ncbi:hypothetical protein HCC36_07180 [Listeria booriae]|uniref:ParB/Sulfiredoxin domain-containing protein n=1 Tax=Listeria booriae TaxID=1552123 RepID=A0A842G8Q8_9LIST|nr:hypothetical protein [Listeria booriae]MBC2293013.1 hypothetical protein [Listeria booriae]
MDIEIIKAQQINAQTNIRIINRMLSRKQIRYLIFTPMKPVPKNINWTDEEINRKKNVEKIPVRNIAGIQRFEGFINWYEIYRKYTKVPAGDRKDPYSMLGKVSIDKLDKLLNVVCKKGISGFKDIIMNPEFNDFPYLIQNGQNKEYYVSSDGSHRVFVAKLIGLEYIYGKVDRYYSLAQ